MLVALGRLAQAQSKGTKATMEAAVQLLNYAASHPDAAIRFRKSGMILVVHSDASYLSEPKARSRVGGYFFLAEQGEELPPLPSTPGRGQPSSATLPRANGPIHIESSVLGLVVTSAAEAELGGLFVNGKEAVVLRQTLTEMGHPQPPTPMITDNITADGIVNETVNQRRSKAIDMRFYWVQDQVKRGHFRVHWRPGKCNLADYVSKQHPPAHHIDVRQTYLQGRPTIAPT